MAKVDEKFIMLLDMDKVFSAEEISDMQTSRDMGEKPEEAAGETSEATDQKSEENQE
jgi:ABC-type uncharacterized transport system substrate-binding protein